jgi:acetylornithine deacetylase/succinyl-diaminopimelate desuccinylase-like protein
MKRNRGFWLVFVFSVVNALSGPSDTLLSRVRDYRSAHEAAIISEFVQLLSIPNVSSDRVNVRRNAEFIKEMMSRRGIDVQVIDTLGNPVVYGEIKVPGAVRTLMFYAHYDGQPVDVSAWTGTDPFKPALRPGKLQPGTAEPAPVPFPAQGGSYDEDWRIYARGSSDDRAPVAGLMTAIDALQASGITLRNNIKFIFEGEEEEGSTNLASFLKEHQDQLQCDILFMCDGPAYYSGDPTLFFGARGVTSLEITVYGPNSSVHSGHYGNWIPNPGIRLSHLLASMREPDGKVKIDGWYDTSVPLSELEIQTLRNIPSYEKEIMENYGFTGPENNWDSLMEAIQYPALNLNGLHSGWVGDQQRTILPSSATVALDVRLVEGNDPDDMLDKIINHVKKQGYYVTDGEPDSATRQRFPLIAKVERKEGGYRASRTPMDHPLSLAAIRALTEQSENKPVLLPSLGGSLAIYLFSDLLQVPIIGVPIANHDNNQHQADENIRIGNLWTGIETYAALLMME